MNIEQLRDRLAELMKWKKLDRWFKPNCTPFEDGHPIPLSLDWLAAHGLPEGWYWWTITRWGKSNMHEHEWTAEANPEKSREYPKRHGGPTELHARLAACVAAWEARAERSGT